MSDLTFSAEEKSSVYNIEKNMNFSGVLVHV